jgi:DNA-binding Lrp family transcriptional regulator
MRGGRVADKEVFLKETEALRDLRTLEEIEKNPHVTQRDLAQRLGVAVGVANSCIRTLVRKGMVKVRGDNNRNITYHLTKQGVLHKTGLAVQWTRNTIGFYRQARRDVGARLAELAASGVRRLALVGTDELAEIAVISAAEAGVEIVGIVAWDQAIGPATILGVPVGGFDDLAAWRPDGLLVTLDLAPGDLERLERLAGDAPIHGLSGPAGTPKGAE